MSRALSVACLLVLTGCGITAPRVRYFEIRPAPAGALAGPKLPAILVPDFGCVSAYDHLRVVIRRSPVEVGASRSLQWSTVPGRMLAQGLSERLEQSRRFENVRREAKPKPPYTLEGQVQVIELNEHPTRTVRLGFHLSVRRSEDGTVIGEETIDETRPAPGGDPADGILVLRDLYSEILDGVTARVIAALERDRSATEAAR
ncbi:MAG: membrane integrity-associated transporter subunit PqiC [Deltaproteobacteria bacterium]|nr:membrane integrity-associated transporter subunit PqiC [Deltaproteobacteria bacterium]